MITIGFKYPVVFLYLSITTKGIIMINTMNELLTELDKTEDKVNWNRISEYQKLSEGFITEHADQVNWSFISENQKLSEGFIREHSDKVDWGCISKYQKLSEGFISEHADKVDWDYISENQKLSEGFIREHDDKFSIPSDSWLYKDIEFKRNYILTNTDYEIDGDYLYAYKSCRSDGYSTYNFQYHYEVGGEYESHADYNPSNENSFGLSAWHEKGARNYCNEKLFKVKIHLDDIACLVHDNQKIRCSKLTIIEEVKYD
jgi:hypothetical protein